MQALDSHSRASEIRAIIKHKPSLKRLYQEIYEKYIDCLNRCPKSGFALELGSGAGFVKQMVPELITSDILPYEGVDQVVDATELPFEDQSISFIGMVNVFHHIPDTERFLQEAQRCLLPGGRLFIVDQHPGYISTPILRFIHHEPFDQRAASWRFESTGPLSGANGALAWIVFVRDRRKFHQSFPNLRLVRYRPHTPLRYWLSGGLNRWNLLPGPAFQFATGMDRILTRISSSLGSFVDIEVVKAGRVGDEEGSPAMRTSDRNPTHARKSPSRLYLGTIERAI